MPDLNSQTATPEPAPTQRSFVALEPAESTLAWWWRQFREFPKVFAIASAFAVISAHWLAYGSLALLKNRAPIEVVALLSLFVLFVSAFVIWSQRFWLPKTRPWVFVTAACAVLYSLDLASLSVHELLHWPWIAPLALFVLVLMVSLATAGRERLVRVKTLRVFHWQSEGLDDEGDKAVAPQRPAEVARTTIPATHLLVLVSEPNYRPTRSGGDGAESTFTFTPNQGSAVSLSRGISIREAIDRLAPIRANWQQLLRGLEPHCESVHTIVLIGSIAPAGGPSSSQRPNAPRGSAGDLSVCQELLKLFLPAKVEIRIHEPSVDFEDVEALIALLTKQVHTILERDASAHVVIETTGGQKSTSIAGAVATLNTPATFQYVSTNEPYTVRLHDLRIDEPPEL